MNKYSIFLSKPLPHPAIKNSLIFFYFFMFYLSASNLKVACFNQKNIVKIGIYCIMIF